MCLIAKVVLIFAIYNTSNPYFGPFVSDISNWFKYHLFAHEELVREGDWILFCMYDHVFDD